jgi:hypothetical protein
VFVLRKVFRDQRRFVSIIVAICTRIKTRTFKESFCPLVSRTWVSPFSFLRVKKLGSGDTSKPEICEGCFEGIHMDDHDVHGGWCALII